MFRTLIWFVYFWLYLLSVLPLWIRLKHLAKQERETEVDDLLFAEARKWARALLNDEMCFYETRKLEAVSRGDSRRM
jgi:1-acyl-sn-glycerol-3-phosphate acyltransferase